MGVGGTLPVNISTQKRTELVPFCSLNFYFIFEVKYLSKQAIDLEGTSSGKMKIRTVIVAFFTVLLGKHMDFLCKVVMKS